MKRLCIHIALYFIVTISLKAQLIEGGLPLIKPSFSAQAKIIGSTKMQANDTLSLPFWDDFAYTSVVPNQTLWSESSNAVFVNDVFSYLAPSYKVATLDGLASDGSAYSNDSRANGYADELTSNPIDLSTFTTTSNIFLSFFWQEGFSNQAPDDVDSLIVQFKDTAEVWRTQLRISGSNAAFPIPFQQEFIPVNQEFFLHAGFQFRFVMYGNLAGTFDSWNVDYVYLNQGNLPVNTDDFSYDSYEDRSFTASPGSLFEPYFSVPLKHITEEWLTDNIQDVSIIYQNLWAGNASNPNFGTEIFSTISQNYPTRAFVDSLLVNGFFLTNNQDTALFNATLEQKQNLIASIISQKETEDSLHYTLQMNLGDGDSLFYENVNGVRIYYPEYSFQQNDTVTSAFLFSDFYALDDGTAESSIRLESRNYLLAQQFTTIGENRITGIDLYAPAIAQNTEAQNITLLVWDKLSTIDNDVKVAQNILVPGSLGLNEFFRVQFDRPVTVSDTIYIGYREESDVPVSLGFDKNSNSSSNLFVNTQGIWERVSDLQGSVMIRPVFEEVEITSSNNHYIETKPVPYPNPFDRVLHYPKNVEGYKLYTIQGDLLDQKTNYNAREIDFSQLPAGIYILKIYSDNQWQPFRILKK